jgi:hypothetical protein
MVHYFQDYDYILDEIRKGESYVLEIDHSAMQMIFLHRLGISSVYRNRSAIVIWPFGNDTSR